MTFLVPSLPFFLVLSCWALQCACDSVKTGAEAPVPPMFVLTVAMLSPFCLPPHQALPHFGLCPPPPV